MTNPTLPPLSILSLEDSNHTAPDPESIASRINELEAQLAGFKLECKVVNAIPGPVVTTFEIQPELGQRTSKYISIADDLARSLSVPSLRVVTNVPGIAIEIPNVRRNTIYLKDVLSSESFQKKEGTLPLTLGTDVTGKPVIEDLYKMPHILLGGTTGSGKSTALNSMICSILFNSTPEQVRFLMIDLKMLEFDHYNGIPHLLTPVVTEVNKAVILLQWARSEMEERYRLMSDLGARNLIDYNQRIENCIKNGEQPTRKVKNGFNPNTNIAVKQNEPIPLELKPQIVIVIDELADLMVQAAKEAEPAICRLAQMSRATGIHLIIATQRPSVNVLTSLIRANLPTRLSFQVSSKIDSRTILDSLGAERLLGMGDALYLPPGSSHLKRIHSPFISDKDITSLVYWLSKHQQPPTLRIEPDMTVLNKPLATKVKTKKLKRVSRLIKSFSLQELIALRKNCNSAINKKQKLIKEAKQHPIMKDIKEKFGGEIVDAESQKNN